MADCHHSTSMKPFLFALAALLSGAAGWVQAAPDEGAVIEMKLGDYRFMPDRIEVAAGSPVTLRLVNTDRITPHNFTLKAPAAGLDLHVAVGGGKTQDITFTPTAAGSYTFYCTKKLPFMKSHRERGMEGTLVVTPAR